MKLKIAYFGTPDFSARLLEKIILDKDLPVEVTLVVTQPDKLVGRKQILTPYPVKVIAQKYGIPLYDQSLPEKLNTKYEILQQCDLALLYAYGEIIPKDLLQAPKHGFWNIHPSLLPKYRGPSPISYPLLLGVTETGVTLMQMDNKLDHGSIIAQETYKILPNDKRPDLESKLTDLGFELFKKSLSAITNSFSVIPSTVEGSLANASSNKLRDSSSRLWRTQNDKDATFTRRLTKQDGYIPLSVLKKGLNNDPLSFDELPTIIKEYYKDSGVPAERTGPQNDVILASRRRAQNPTNFDASQVIFNLFRGLYPWPGVWTVIKKSHFAKAPRDMRLKITDLGLYKIQDTKYEIRIHKVQLEGKQEVNFEQFQTSYNVL